MDQFPQNQMPQSPTPEEPHRHFFNKKFGIIAVAILVCAGAGYGAVTWYANQQLTQEVVATFTPRPTDSTANWKTYTNTQYGFEFKYPDSFVLDLSTEDQFEVMLKGVNNDSTFFYVFPKGFSDPGRVSLFDTGVKTEDTLLAGEPSREYAVTQSSVTFTSKIFNLYAFPSNNWTNKNEVGYQIDAGDEKYTSMLDQILSTFKFTDTAGLKTYINTQYGFSFQYPDSWAKVVGTPAISSDTLPSNRTFVAIFPITYPAQDFSGRVDVYKTSQANVFKNDTYMKYEAKIGDITIGGSVWTKFSTPNGFDYFTENKSQTYEVSGTKEVTDQILSTFKFTQ